MSSRSAESTGPNEPHAPARAPDPPKPPAHPRWFTADELPMPPPEMRLPPGETEPTLFDELEEE